MPTRSAGGREPHPGKGADSGSSRSGLADADTIHGDQERNRNGLDNAEDFIPAMVDFLNGDRHRGTICANRLKRELDFGVTSVNYDFAELLPRAEAPR